jgi:cytochrome c oxidase subunit 3
MEQEVNAHSDPRYRLMNNRLGLWLFLISDSFVFGALFITRFYLLGNTRPHLEPMVGLVVTVVLITSSFFMNRGETHMRNGNVKGFLQNTFITLLLGILFIIGVVGVEWRIAPFGPADGAQGAVFYIMTAYHAFHVFTGVIFLLVILSNGRKGVYTKDKYWGVEACAIYWHFVDVVWIFFYPALYLIGTVV